MNITRDYFCENVFPEFPTFSRHFSAFPIFPKYIFQENVGNLKQLQNRFPRNIVPDLDASPTHDKSYTFSLLLPTHFQLKQQYHIRCHD